LGSRGWKRRYFSAPATVRRKNSNRFSEDRQEWATEIHGERKRNTHVHTEKIKGKGLKAEGMQWCREGELKAQETRKTQETLLTLSEKTLQ